MAYVAIRQLYNAFPRLLWPVEIFQLSDSMLACDELTLDNNIAVKIFWYASQSNIFATVLVFGESLGWQNLKPMIFTLWRCMHRLCSYDFYMRELKSVLTKELNHLSCVNGKATPVTPPLPQTIWRYFDYHVHGKPEGWRGTGGRGRHAVTTPIEVNLLFNSCCSLTRTWHGTCEQTDRIPTALL